MHRARQPKHLLAAFAAPILLLVVTVPASAAGGESASDNRALSDGLTASLDGRPIRLGEVGNWYCDDFDYPTINCFSQPGVLEDRATLVLAASTGNYVVIYDYTAYAGSYMYVSQDYSVLAVIGWNDRISSLRSINAGAGQFFVDWFYGGNAFAFCCNSQYASLGSYDNTFSSVHRL